MVHLLRAGQQPLTLFIDYGSVSFFQKKRYNVCRFFCKAANGNLTTVKAVVDFAAYKICLTVTYLI